MAFGVHELRNHLDMRLNEIERKLEQMATRADFDALKATLKTEIQTIVQSVADLKAQLAAGQPITDQDLTDLQSDIDALTGGPTPVPTPAPGP